MCSIFNIKTYTKGDVRADGYSNFTQSLFPCSYGKPFKKLEPKKMSIVEQILKQKNQDSRLCDTQRWKT